MSLSPFDVLGFRLDGRPFYGFSGADGEDGGGGDDSDSDDGEDAGAEKNPVKVLETTLTKVRAERKAVQDELRPVKAVLRELGIDSPEALRAALTKGSGKQDQPVDIEKVREDARNEIRLEANRDLALAKVEAAAKGMFADPDDAVDHLRRNVDDLLGRDGKPDRNAIKRELDDLLAAKPHWGVTERKDVSFDGGARQPGGAEQGMDSWLRDKARQKRGG